MSWCLCVPRIYTSFTTNDKNRRRLFLRRGIWQTKCDDRVGHLNTILARGGGNLNDPILKSSNDRGLPVGMLKFRFDGRISPQCKHPVMSRLPSHLRILFLSSPDEVIWFSSGDKRQPEMLANWNRAWEEFIIPGHKFQEKHLHEWTFKHGLDGKCKSCISSPSFGTVKHRKFRPSVFLCHENIRKLKHATFLSEGRQPEVNILHARTVVSPSFQPNRPY